MVWLGFLTCTQMLMYAIAHRGCTGTVRVSIGSWLGEKSLATPGAWSCISIVPGVLVVAVLLQFLSFWPAAFLGVLSTLKLRPHVEFEALRLPHWNWGPYIEIEAPPHIEIEASRWIWGTEAPTLKLRHWGPHIKIEARTLKLRPPPPPHWNWGPHIEIWGIEASHIEIEALRPPHWNWGTEAPTLKLRPLVPQLGHSTR